LLLLFAVAVAMSTATHTTIHIDVTFYGQLPSQSTLLFSPALTLSSYVWINECRRRVSTTTPTHSIPLTACKAASQYLSDEYQAHAASAFSAFVPLSAALLRPLN
jgi:hypothetical protein